MNRRPRISVALCTHNGANFIEEQLLSILSQTTLPDEVVVSDDASTDDTVDRVTAVWAKQPKSADLPELRVLRNTNALGVTKNFEQALLACRGDVIALSDQDDRWHENRIDRSINHLEGDERLLFMHTDATLVDEHGASLQLALSEGLGISRVERAELEGGNGYRTLLRRNLATGATSMIRRDLLELTTPFPAHWIHDEWLAIIAAAVGGHSYLPEQLIDYRQHPTNQIGVMKLNMAGKLGRLMETRGDRYNFLLARASELASGLHGLGDAVTFQVREQARSKLAHHEMRATIPGPRWKRIVPVMREMMTGRYFRYSRGFADAVRDLVQPF